MGRGCVSSSCSLTSSNCTRNSAPPSAVSRWQSCDRPGGEVMPVPATQAGTSRTASVGGQVCPQAPQRGPHRGPGQDNLGESYPKTLLKPPLFFSLCLSVFSLILSRKGKAVNIYEASAAMVFRRHKTLPVEWVEMQLPCPAHLDSHLGWLSGAQEAACQIEHQRASHAGGQGTLT